jgi:Aspartyl protease
MPTPRVEWRHSGRSLIVPVAILPDADSPNAFDTVRTDGLVDTGATTTGIRGDIADRLGLVAQGQRRVETANGPIWAREYVVRIGLIPGDYCGANFDPDAVLPFVFERHFVVFELLRGFTYPVLVGMDVIARCDLHVLRNGTARIDLP